MPVKHLLTLLRKLRKLLKKGDKRICQDGVAGEVSDDVEDEVLVVDMLWVQSENVSAQTVVIGNLINEVFLVIQLNAPDVEH